MFIVTVTYSIEDTSSTYTLATCHSYKEADDVRQAFYASSPFAEFASVDIRRF